MKGSVASTDCQNCGAKLQGPICSQCGSQAHLEQTPMAARACVKGPVPQIAIIGTEGSGKTVLITTLAKRFSQISADGAFLNPLDNKTLRYVESNWQILGSQEWPPSTPAGQFIDLRWRLQCGAVEGLGCNLRLVDPPGQDLRRLFSDDDPAAIDVLPHHLRQLAAYYQAADIVICLVNLKDFEGEADSVRRTDNEIVIKSALQRLSGDEGESRRLFLLFTQTDLYQHIRREHGNWAQVAKKFLPYVYGAHVSRGQVKVGAVAAVHDTIVIIDAEGRPRRAPAPDFESRGLDTLMNDVAKEAAQIVANRERERQSVPAIVLPPAEPNSPDAAGELLFEGWQFWGPTPIRWVVGIFAMIFFLLYWAASPREPYAEPLPLAAPKITPAIDEGIFYSGITLRNDSDFVVRGLNCQVVASAPGQKPLIKSFHCDILRPGETIPAGNDASANSLRRDSHSLSVRSLQFVPRAGTWGIDFGRIHDQVWVKNDGLDTVQSLSLTVRAHRGNEIAGAVTIQASNLLPGKVFRQIVQLPRGDRYSAELISWSD